MGSRWKKILYTSFYFFANLWDDPCYDLVNLVSWTEVTSTILPWYLLCYPYIFNVLLYTHVINCTKHIIVLNKPTIVTMDFHDCNDIVQARYRPLSRRLDRCDRMIQNESRGPNGGNMCLFSAATCTSQCKFRSLRTNAHLSALLDTFRESLASLSIAMEFLP